MNATRGRFTDIRVAGRRWPPRVAHGFSMNGLSRLTVLGIVGIVAMAVASYLPALRAGFVWDDAIFTQEPLIGQWSGLWNIWFSPADIRKEGHYWPVVFTSFCWSTSCGVSRPSATISSTSRCTRPSP